MSKLINFNKDYKNTLAAINGAVSHLALQMPTAIRQQCYTGINPDNNISPEDRNAMQGPFNSALTEFYKLIPMVQDMAAAQNGDMTYEDLAVKYTIDISSYSEELKDKEIVW